MAHWRDLAHRGLGALQAAGLDLRLDTRATQIKVADRTVHAAGGGSFGYDRLVIATGAVPALPPIAGLAELDTGDGLHVLQAGWTGSTPPAATRCSPAAWAARWSGSFDRVVAATGLRAARADQTGCTPLVAEHTADDHKVYYPGATPLRIRLTGDRHTGRLLGAQLLGHYGAEVAKSVDILATAISNGAGADLPRLDMSYTPPVGSPFDALQHAADAWTAAAAAAGALPASRPAGPDGG